MESSVNLTYQLQQDYLAYSMAVVVGRAIPSLTDGLKPAQRRVLTAMKWLGLRPDGKYMKSARVEGETMGKLHPHGGAYGVMVTLAAPWNNNLPLIDGQGNWGSSVDGAAAARYTEARLSPFAWDVLLDNSETWTLTDTYDGSLKEPTELNVKVPLVLLNGQEGIGVGFATKIPPHSLQDICAACCKDTPLTPSFPTGCDIVGDSGLESYQKTGVGSLRLRARHNISMLGTGKRLKPVASFSCLPYGTNPEKLGQQIKDGLDKGTIAGVVDIRDDSDLRGDCLTVTFRAGTDVDLAIRQLYHFTDLDTKYSARLLVVDGTRPVELSPSELIARWKKWRLDRLVVQFKHELEGCEGRLEIVRGYLKALTKIDAVIKIIRSSKTPKEALTTLVSSRTLKFTADQAKAIMEMKLRALTNLDVKALEEEGDTLLTRIKELDNLLQNEKSRVSYLTKEIKAIGKKYGEDRRSSVILVPESLKCEAPSSPRTSAPRPRFLRIDQKRGTIEQVKGPRGAIILEKGQKLVTLTQDGTLRKLPNTYKGPLGEGYSPVLLATREVDVKERTYLMVFTLDQQLKAMALSGEDLAKATSRGKQVLPPGGTLVYFGEGSYSVPWVSPRKKKAELSSSTVKTGKLGGKGTKIADLTDVRQ